MSDLTLVFNWDGSVDEAQSSKDISVERVHAWVGTTYERWFWSYKMPFVPSAMLQSGDGGVSTVFFRDPTDESPRADPFTNEESTTAHVFWTGPTAVFPDEHVKAATYAPAEGGSGGKLYVHFFR